MSTTLASIIQSLDGDKKLEALSQAAEAAERYEDMVQIMNALVSKKLNGIEELSSDLRNLLSVAYKNVVGAKRSSWRMLNEDLSFDINQEIVDDYKVQVESELQAACTEVLGLLEGLAKQNSERLKEASGSNEQECAECQVFYLKMIGDYYRYLTEAFRTNEDYKSKCNKYYAEAMELAKDKLEATHPTRLGLALNFSVCHYEILEQKEEACKLAKEAFDEAIEKLDSLNDASYKDSTLIMQLLRDNLTIWTQTDEPADQ
jgi:hypothetical protein